MTREGVGGDGRQVLLFGQCSASACSAGDLGSIPELRRPLEKEMVTHSSTLAWKIPWMEEPGRLQSMGSQRVRHDLTTSHGLTQGFLGGSEVKESACNAGDLGSIPELGRSPGEENGCPLQYSCLKNSMDRKAWWATVRGITKSWT